MSKVRSFFILVFAAASLAAAQAQTLKAGDQLAIQNALSQWDQFQDDANVAGFVSLWTANATFANAFGNFQGSAAIKQFEDGYVAGFAKGKRHQRANTVVVGSETSATVVQDLNLFEVADFPMLVATARMNAALVKENGAWKFKEVKLALDPGTMKAMAKMNAGK